ncbi:MAG: hypothetical protein RLZZ387_237 [Chloroflexota bacterium]
MMSLQMSSVRPAVQQPMVVLDAPSDWRAVVVDTYLRAEQEDTAALHAVLVRRVAALTGRVVPPEEVFLGRGGRQATAAVDGMVFRLQAGELVVMRPCDSCGVGLIASPAITSRADLGYALGVWQPRCARCGPDDDHEEDRTWSW